MLDTDLSLCGRRICTPAHSLSSEKPFKRAALLCYLFWGYLGHSGCPLQAAVADYSHRASGNARRKRPLVKSVLTVLYLEGSFCSQALSCDCAHCRGILNPGVIWNMAGGFCVPSHSALDLLKTLFKQMFEGILYSPLETWQHIQFAKYDLILKLIGCSFIILNTEVFRN